MAQADDKDLVLALIDQAAQQVDRHFTVYDLALFGALSRAVDSREIASPYTKHALEIASNELQIALVGSLHDLLPGVVAQLQERAVDAANPRLGQEKVTELTDLNRDSENTATGRLISAMLNDANTALKTWRELAFATRTRVVQGQGAKTAAYQVRTGHLASVKFKQMDRAGRQWDSPLYAKTTMRGMLLNTYVESYLYALAAKGVDLARVEQPEGHDHAGIVFSITGQTEGYKTFDDIQFEVFHPNSSALVSQA